MLRRKAVKLFASEIAFDIDIKLKTNPGKKSESKSNEHTANLE